MVPESLLPEHFHETSVIKEIPLAGIRVDRSYQREPSQTLVEEIANNWDVVASELVLVSDRGVRDPEGDVEGGLWLVNGQHRSLAAQRRGKTAIWARIVDLSELEDPAAVEAALRLKLNVKLGDRPLERFKAQLRAGNEESLDIVKILARFDTEINVVANPESGINAVSTVESLYRVDNGGLLAETLEIIRDAYKSFHGRSVSASLMKGIAWFILKHAEKADRGRLVEKLATQGTESLHRKSVTVQSTMGGSLWLNYYRTIVDFYNEQLRDKNRLDWQVRGAHGWNRGGGNSSPGRDTHI